MKDFQYIKLKKQGAVAVLSLNRPDQLNAFSQPMRRELLIAIPELEADPAVRIVVLTGAGRAFSAGADLAENMPGFDRFTEQCAAEYKPWLQAIHDSEKIYIAAIKGACAGIGCAVALNCDLVTMSEDGYFYQAFAAIGLMPDGGATKLLLDKLGYFRAFEMVVTAGKLEAKQALDWGLVNKVFATESLLDDSVTWAQQLAKGAPLAQKAVKQLMRKASAMSYSEVVDTEAVMQSDLIESQDAQNAVRAFLAKQTYAFTGK